MLFRHFTSLVFTAAILAPFNTLTFAGVTNIDSTFQQVLRDYQQLKTLAFDDSKTMQVNHLCFQKDRARISLQHGTLYFTEPIEGTVTGAVFLGEGVLELKPPTTLERAQVRRFLDKDSLNEAFSAAYFRFSDQTLLRKVDPSEFQNRTIPDRVTRFHEKASRFLVEERGFNISSRILSDLVNPSFSKFFLAIFVHQERKHDLHDYLVFIYNPRAEEEVAMFQYFPHRVKKPFYTLCSFPQLPPPQTQVAGSDDGAEQKEAIRITHYDMKVKLNKNGHIAVDAQLTYLPNWNDLRFLTFDLFEDLNIDSVKASSGDTLPYIKEKKEAAFSVVLNQPTTVRQSRQLIVYYSGKALEPMQGNLLLKDKLKWLPRYGYLKPATYDVTFEYSRNWQAVAVGKKIEQWEEGKTAFSRWVESVPSLGMAFAYGNLDSTAFRRPGHLPVKIYSTKNRFRRTREKIGGDVANSFYFFQHLLGGYPYAQLNVVETPGLTSNGYPGLLFLTWLTFNQELKGVDETLRGHEVAHQWWGNLVGWKSYHDQWLSEGFAEYSGALATQFLLDGDKTFYQIVDGWKTDLLEKGHIGVSVGLRRFGFSKTDLSKSEGLKAGPISLGHRLGDKYPVDYYLITYQKGAYVLHMLRTLMQDLDTHSDARFWNMLADFVATFKGKQASTADFKKIVEKHVGQNMDWFFDQWVNGTDIPTYYYRYKTINDGEHFWVQLKVRQEEVPSDFRMYIPVSVKLSADVKKSQRILMDNREKSFRLGPFEMPPEKVIFDDFKGVLARVKRKKI
ncbi:MAG: M1 family metallopeptidase [bacterium]